MLRQALAIHRLKIISSSDVKFMICSGYGIFKFLLDEIILHFKAITDREKWLYGSSIDALQSFMMTLMSNGVANSPITLVLKLR